MSIIVVGPGRSGTNMALEILRCSPSLEASSPAENKALFKMTNIPENYLTKCDTCYTCPEEVVSLLRSDENVKLVWCIRDPRDMILSKMYRGRPREEGGDCNGLADDATLEGAVEDMNHAKSILDKLLIEEFMDRIFYLHMESVITRTQKTINMLCSFLKIEYSPSMLEFYKTMRHPDKKARYNKIDTSQVKLWERVNEVYDGYFKDMNTKRLFKAVEGFTKFYGY